MATLASLRVMARVPTGAAPSGPARSIRAGATNQHHRITRGKSVVARSSVDVEEAEGGAFDDALADVFKQLYPSGGVKRIKWGVFKEDVDASSVTTTEEEQAALRDEASSSLTNIDADERARRGKAGTAFGIACALIAVVQLATGAPPAQRAIMAVPLFLGLGFKGSEATGL
tara:strand:- start:327 stop:842 length:516 start_codon:yes stop_codon:yes gene_type:complete